MLDKDIMNRDALQLITKYSIVKFLDSQFAENVVKEIWRSPYATCDHIMSASTNFYLLFEYYHCIVDEEYNNRLYKGKSVKNIQNHSM